MQMTVDESKNLSLIPEIVIHLPILLLLQLCINRPHRYANFQFCSFIPANILTSVQRCMYVGMASRSRTTSDQRWNNVVYVSVEVYNFQQSRINVMSISTLNWITLDNVEITLSFSASIFTTLGNVETTLRIWPFEKKIKSRAKNKLIFLSLKWYAGLEIFFIFSPF